MGQAIYRDLADMKKPGKAPSQSIRAACMASGCTENRSAITNSKIKKEGEKYAKFKKDILYCYRNGSSFIMQFDNRFCHRFKFSDF